jgi:CheY-like chemotaxis protein
MPRVAERTVLIVEPNSDARAQLRATLEAKGYSVTAVSSGDEALSVVGKARIRLVVTELYLENRKSRCLLNAIAESSPYGRTKVLAYTRHGRARDRAWAVAAGADGYVLKRHGEARLLDVAGRLTAGGR